MSNEAILEIKELAEKYFQYDKAKKAIEGYDLIIMILKGLIGLAAVLAIIGVVIGNVEVSLVSGLLTMPLGTLWLKIISWKKRTIKTASHISVNIEQLSETIGRDNASGKDLGDTQPKDQTNTVINQTNNLSGS